MTRYEVMKQWTEGFAAGIAGCLRWDDKQNEHWKAGYTAGYEMRKAKNEALDEYLVSTDREPQAVIRLADKGK